jgi:hypothetical protein
MPAILSSHPGADISRGSLWFGATAAAIAWALEGAITEVIASEACRTGTGSWGPLSPGGTKIVLAIVTLIALAVSVAAILVSFRNWRRLSEACKFMSAEAGRRGQFMGLVGVFAGVALAAGIIWSGLPLIFLDVCVKAR